MSNRIKLIGIDLDGTLLHTDHSISQRNIQTLNTVSQSGILIIPVTGRSFNSIPKELLTKVPKISYIISANGALVSKIPENKHIYHDAFSNEQLESILEFLKKEEILIELYSESKVYVQKKEYARLQDFIVDVKDPAILKYFEHSRTLVDDLYDVIQNEKMILKVHVLLTDLVKRSLLMEELRKDQKLCITSATGKNIEINTRTSNKGDSLQKFAQTLGIHPQEIMVIGDNGNDQTMLSMAGLSVAMGNAVKEIKELADFVTLTNDEDGVAYAIEQLILSEQAHKGQA
ncbi:haloacid dehalogenase [Clostridia bacterium]|nr:haloacid dehalogenase [Clostridia bacterium]